MTDYISVRATLWAIKSVCKMLLILARLNACESRGSALLTIRSGKTFNEQRHRHAAAGGLVIIRVFQKKTLFFQKQIGGTRQSSALRLV